ncbi:MAG: hypothetical protein IJN29_07640 [Akkermansia sp.]|nr:hypothetical protein [Akkermansia sp.]
MALHIEMSEEAATELRMNALKNKLSSVLACVLFMLMGGGILYFTAVFIVGESPASFLAYIPPTEDAPPSETFFPREMMRHSSSSSSAVNPTVTVVTGVTNISMAPVEIDMSEGLSLDSSPGLSLGLSDELGESLGNGGGGLGSGSSGGSALVGTFYDLKQTGKGRSCKVSDLATKGADGTLTINRNKYYEAIANFLNKGWSAAQLSKYYESPDKLYASNFYMPVGKAEYAPIAYKVGDGDKDKTQWICQPSGWCVVYRGKVRAPKTGTFRFIGMGDDCIAVRFNRKLVLEGGYRLPSAGPTSPKFQLSTQGGRDAFFKDVKAGRDHDHKGYELINTIEGIGVWGKELGGLMAGAEFKVEEGKTYPIEILVVEEGGKFGFMLFIEDITNGKNSKGKKYDIFRTNFSTPSAKEVNDLLKKEKCHVPGMTIDVPYNEDSPIWTAVP